MTGRRQSGVRARLIELLLAVVLIVDYSSRLRRAAIAGRGAHDAVSVAAASDEFGFLVRCCG